MMMLWSTASFSHNLRRAGREIEGEKKEGRERKRKRKRETERVGKKETV